MSTFGNIFKITTFGESHSKAVGVVVDNFPSNFEINFDAIQLQLNRRKPGQSNITTPRSESDVFTVLSGVENGKSLGNDENQDEVRLRHQESRLFIHRARLLNRARSKN